MKFLDNEEVRKISVRAAKIADEKKCDDIKLLDLGKKSSIADFFLFLTSDSSAKTNAVLNDLQRYFKAKKIGCISGSDFNSGNMWTLLDYGFIVIHIFSKEGREYYDLDKLWHEANEADYLNEPYDDTEFRK